MNTEENNLTNNQPTAGVGEAIPPEVPLQNQNMENIPAEVNYQPEANLSPPPPPTVIVPPEGNGKPFWLYLLFAVTIVIFIAITFLLVASLKQKSSSPEVPPTPFPSVTPLVTREPTLRISPTPKENQATEAAVLNLRKLRQSDELTDIEADLNETDLAILEESLNFLNLQIGLIPR